MSSELTFDQEQDISNYKQWLAESQWEQCMQREAEALANLQEQEDDDIERNFKQAQQDLRQAEQDFAQAQAERRAVWHLCRNRHAPAVNAADAASDEAYRRVKAAQETFWKWERLFWEQ